MESHKLTLNGKEMPISTPDGFGQMVEDAFAREYKRPEKVESPIIDGEGNPTGERELIDNPVSKADFALGKILEHIRAVVAADRKKQARRTTEAMVDSENEALKSQISIG